MEQYIGFVIVLFLLSMICERLADFFKHYLSEVNTGLARKIKRLLRIGNLVSRFPDASLQEDKRYYRILKINIFCGFAIAYALHADLFSIIANKEEPFNAIGWKTFKWFWTDIRGTIAFIIGCFATGFFISFGSKFWHDLLDILLQIKNYRRLLADPDTYRFDKISSFDQYISLYPSYIANPAHQQFRSSYIGNTSVSSIALRSDRQGYYFEIVLRAPDASIPDFYDYALPNGIVKRFRVNKIIDTEKIKPHALSLSDSIYNTSRVNNIGTIGCLVRKVNDNGIYVLTCYHNVVEPGSNFVFSIQSPNKVELADKKQQLTGKMIYGLRDYEVDAALIQLDVSARKKLRNVIPQIGLLTGVRDISTIKVEDKVRVFMNGRKSGTTEGMITGISDAKIEYEDGDHVLFNLLMLEHNGRSISKPGDSGACIIDENNALVGILVAGRNAVSYAIPASIVFSKLSVELVTN